MLSTAANRNLWTYALATGVSRFGSQFQFLAVTSLTYAITGSPLATAAQGAISFLPSPLLARWTGPVADRHDPRRVLTIVSLIQALLTLCYLLTESVTVVLALNFLVASAGVFLPPARAALLPQMVGRAHLLQANARLSSINGAVQLFAPALAGMILIRTGASWAFLFNSISFLFPAVAAQFIRIVEPVVTRPSEAAEASTWATTWQFLRERRDLLLLLGGYAAYSLGMWAVNALFYPYAADVLERGADVVGWSISAYFGAFLVTGLALERWGSVLRQPRLMYGGFLVGALIWSGYTLTASVPLVILLSAFDGIVYTYAFTLFQTRIQEEAPPDSRGRVFALITVGDDLAIMTGMLLGGALATWGGVLSGIRLSTGLSVVLVLAAIVAAGRPRSIHAWSKSIAEKR